ncbi:DUF567-domain-containing protein [Anaeromyces robustus]|uniref:DUF567-domain-containing protein n=1 Tax=Anaeromyces robustus TaxID=1754192 RepID=A0A1Y1VRJ9_9FUNG|nr:DUF567-domain-containing protein [Anaeromyces robustus]|eukprot:ORX63922.1 DUF567-domain-containing protein [Anaeromyces robustus]
MTENKYEIVSGYIKSPSNKIIITDERFCLQKPETFVLKEKFFSLSSDDFSIKDVNGVKYFKCLGKAFSIQEKKVLYDLNNEPILNIREKVISLRGKMNIYEGKTENKVLLTIKPKSPIFNRQILVNFYNKATGKDEIFEIKCDLFDFGCDIYYGKKKNGAPLICSIHSKIDAKSIITSSDHYYVTVAANVDIAAMIALAIVYDENENDNKASFLDSALDLVKLF